jgi:hypothetical protein
MVCKEVRATALCVCTHHPPRHLTIHTVWWCCVVCSVCSVVRGVAGAQLKPQSAKISLLFVRSHCTTQPSKHGNAHSDARSTVIGIRRWCLGCRRQDVVRATQLARVEARMPDAHGTINRLESWLGINTTLFLCRTLYSTCVPDCPGNSLALALQCRLRCTRHCPRGHHALHCNCECGWLRDLDVRDQLPAGVCWLHRWLCVQTVREKAF